MILPRIMIAGTHSGVGKTTLTTAIMAAMTNNGHTVQPFKVGPDYIDPGYHFMATGYKSRNLDPWMLGEDTTIELFRKNALNKDISVIEGVMGVFDGISGNSSFGSSAHVAKLTQTPVILIVDVKSMARSAAALIYGFSKYDPELNIAGLILNRVGSSSHFQMLQDAIKEVTDIPIVGYLPKIAQIQLPERHLGLVPSVEHQGLDASLQAMMETINNTIDLNQIIAIASDTPRLEPGQSCLFAPLKYAGKRVRIGIAQDAAFNFYYSDGLDYLSHLGADFVEFSPLHDTRLPSDLDGLVIGGGFPEMFPQEISKNKSMITEIRLAYEMNMPIYAECGGLMYLSQYITDFAGVRFPMVGLLPFGCSMQKKLVAMGYVKARPVADNLLAIAGEEYRGHEFHYSHPEDFPVQGEAALELVRNRDGQSKYDGFAKGRLLASYVHLHFAAFPQGAKRFLDYCRQFQVEKL